MHTHAILINVPCNKNINIYICVYILSPDRKINKSKYTRVQKCIRIQIRIKALGTSDSFHQNNNCSIYTIILLKFVCRSYQTAGRNSCSIVSGDVANGSYRLKALPLKSSHLGST